MIYSMTGFGSSRVRIAELEVYCEVKSINSKFFDFNVRTNIELSSKEIEIKRVSQEYLSRGKISLSIEVTSEVQKQKPGFIDQQKFLEIFNALEKLAEKTNAKNPDTFRDTVTLFNAPIEEDSYVDKDWAGENWESLKTLINESLKQCVESRASEGNKLRLELSSYSEKIQEGLAVIQSIEPKRLGTIRERIKAKLEEVVQDFTVDQSRFEQELIYYIEKLDISEEIVRLKSHLEYFNETLHSNTHILNGKKLGFISQELGREINTIGSKANDIEIQKNVVHMKEQLEKIKEQLLNVL